jgi:nucleoside-diphosphate-sugar epimerase
MRILVTGATGFIGGHSIPVLEARGHSLTLALRNPDVEGRCLGAGRHRGRRAVVVGEIDKQTDWREALQGADAVVHLAARAHVLDGEADEADEEAFMRINARGTAQLIDQAIDAGVGHFVLMSSIGAVTTASDMRVTLDTPCTPDTPYGQSKRAAERALIERATGSQMGWTILRPTLVYGPGNPGNMKRLIALVKRGVPLPLGAIQNRRSFTFVRNLVDVTAVVLSHPDAKGATFLVADGEDLSTPELIQKIALHAGVRAPLLSVPSPVIRGIARAADAWSAATGSSVPFGTTALRRLESSLYVDIEPLRARLDWTPPFGVDEGLRCMLTP